MTTPDGNHEPTSAQADDSQTDDRRALRDSDPMLGVLRSALDAPPPRQRSLLPKIQDRIRRRTRGRYFKDRYSRALDPVPLLLTMALLVLLLSAAFFLLLQPLSERPTPVELQRPAPDLIEGTDRAP